MNSILTARKAGLISNDTATAMLTDTPEQHEAKAKSLRSLARAVPDVKKKIDLHQRAAKHTTAAQQMRGGNRDMVKNRTATQDANGLFTKGGGDYQTRAATHITKRDFHNQQAAKLEAKATPAALQGKYSSLSDGAKAAAHHAAADLHQQAATALLQAGGRSERTGDGTDAMALSHQANAASARLASGNAKATAQLAKNWSEDQTCDPDGKFSGGGGGDMDADKLHGDFHPGSSQSTKGIASKAASAKEHQAAAALHSKGSVALKMGNESLSDLHATAADLHGQAAQAEMKRGWGANPSQKLAYASRADAATSKANAASAKLGM